MFSNRECVTLTKSLDLPELESEGSLTTPPVKAHGSLWKCLFLWQNGRIKCKVGLDRSPESIQAMAVRACLVIQSSHARLRRTSYCLLTCMMEAEHATWAINIHDWEMELLDEDGVLEISVFLEIYQPVSFRTIPQTANYSLSLATDCRSIVGTDHQGSVYVLCSLSVLSTGIGQWGVYSFRPCNPDRGVILARLNMRPSCLGSGFDPENKRLAVTQVYDHNSSLQLDILDWESGHHTSRIYSIQEDQDLRWSAATPHKEGWLCIASGVREDPRMVHHRFWLLGEDGRLKLLTELVQATPLKFVYPAASLNGKFYCMVATRGVRYRYLIFVSSWEKPGIWQPYEMAPYPYFYKLKFYLAWGHMVLVGKVTSSGPDHSCIQQNALFKLRFDGADCLIEPYIIFPNTFHDWIIGGDAFLGFTIRGNKSLSVLPVQPLSLKIRTLLDVGEQLKKGRRAGNEEWRNRAEHVVRILT